MSRAPDRASALSPSLTLAEYTVGGDKGFWLYDSTRMMNLAMRAETETAALVKALTYYQSRLAHIENEHGKLKMQVAAFVSQFAEEEDES